MKLQCVYFLLMYNFFSFFNNIQCAIKNYTDTNKKRSKSGRSLYDYKLIIKNLISFKKKIQTCQPINFETINTLCHYTKYLKKNYILHDNNEKLINSLFKYKNKILFKNALFNLDIISNFLSYFAHNNNFEETDYFKFLFPINIYDSNLKEKQDYITILFDIKNSILEIIETTESLNLLYEHNLFNNDLKQYKKEKDNLTLLLNQIETISFVFCSDFIQSQHIENKIQSINECLFILRNKFQFHLF